MLKEQLSSHPRMDWSELSFSFLGMVEHGKERLQKVRSSIEGRRVVESAHKNWDNTNYCRSLSQDAPYQYTLPQLLDVFPANFQTFTDEYCLGSLVKQYPLNVDATGMHGLDSTYKEPLSAQASRFQEKVSEKGKRHQRAAVETFNSQRLDHWLTTVCQDSRFPLGYKMVWCSPPGFKAEGYHGVGGTHHSFIWVYQKEMGADGKPCMTMTQFRCWPSLAQMEGIQAELRDKSCPSDVLEAYEIDTAQLTRRNATIAEFFELPPDVTMDEIEDSIYSTEDDWPVNRSEMPQLYPEEITAFEVYRDALLHQFLLPTYRQLLADEYRLIEPYSSPFWESESYAKLIDQLDTVFALTWQHLLKYIDIVTEKDSQSTLPHPTRAAASLREMFALKLRFDNGQSTKQDRERFNALAPNLLSVGSKILSIGQCGIGTFIPLHLLKGMDQLNMLSSFSSLSQLDRFDIMKLSAQEQRVFKKDVLSQYRSMTLTGRNGKKETFWVLEEYYDDYLKNSYQNEAGEFVGPCHLSLSSGLDSYVLTNEKYQELLHAAQTTDELADLESEEQDKLAHATTEKERKYWKDFYSKKRLTLKNTVSVTELVNNDLFRPTFARV